MLRFARTSVLVFGATARASFLAVTVRPRQLPAEVVIGEEGVFRRRTWLSGCSFAATPLAVRHSLGGAALLTGARHVAAAAGGGGGSLDHKSGLAADGKAGKDGKGTHAASNSSSSGGGSGSAHPTAKSKGKKTKLVKKLVRKPHGGAGAVSASSNNSNSGNSNGSAGSAGATASASAPSASTPGGGHSGSAQYKSALKGKPKTAATKLLRKKRLGTAATGTGTAAGTTAAAGGAATGSTASGAGSGGKRKKRKFSKKLSSAARSRQASRKNSASTVTSAGYKAPKGHRKATGKTGAAAVAPTAGRSTKASRRTAAVSKASAGGAASSVKSGRKGRKKKLRVCVLSSSYDGADSATAVFDNFLCTPEHYAKKDKKKYTFDDVSVKKIDSYRTIRELVTSNKYDVFFNLCDGGRDEKRAGVDVVEALEELNAAFTGTDSRSFEPSKIDMKLLVGSCGVKVPNFVLLENADGLAKKCRHLRFPVIVKHLSGYASVGINKDNRCDDFDQLKKKVPAFIKEYNHALVEEFIRGREGTVLACADATSMHGVKVFKPLMFNFLKDGDDFAYFEKKWNMTCDDNAYNFLPHTDPAYAAIMEMARNAYKYIMNGVGYGRVDFRIDDRTGEPNFLEINPNCGMWYSEKDGGDFADIMVQGDPTWNHERFLANAVLRALREQAARKPWYFISHDKSGQFSTRASRTVPAGKCLFGDAVHPIPVVSKSLYKLGAEDPSVGAVICRGDGTHQAVAIRHSCEPNMQFVHGRTLLFAAKRQISVGEELTVDYATLRDENMPTFACSCGTQNCRSVIFAMPATMRTLEVKAAKRLMREKKRLWLKKRSDADKEAERLLKKRTAAAASGAQGGERSSDQPHGHSSSSSSSSNSHSSSSSSSSHAGGGGNGGVSNSHK